MMKWDMEIHPNSSFLNSSNWCLGEIKSTKWTQEENKLFENALAKYDKDTPDRWERVAAMIPGKTEIDVMEHYKKLEDDVSNIEAGLIPTPGYTTSSFTLDWRSNRGFDGLKQSYGACGKRSSSSRISEQERKKGVPWTEEEHRLFLLGLKTYGKGDWRNISRNFVGSRTPTQVASHAQKYFLRQRSGGKDKRRSSIHDITTVNLTDTRPPSSPDNNTPSSPDQSTLTQLHNSVPKLPFDWNQSKEGTAGIVFNPTHGNLFMPMPSPYGINSYGQNFRRSHIEAYNPIFQMQSSQHHSFG